MTALRLTMILLAWAVAGASPAWAAWLEGRSANFIVYSNGSETGLRASLQRLEDHDRLLRVLTATTAAPSAAPLKVYLVGSRDELNQAVALPRGVLGVYLARVGGAAAVAMRGDRPGVGGEEVLLHEYAHHFAARYHPAYYPRWYGEGFAEYLMTATVDGDRAEIGRPNVGRAATLLRGAWLPIDRVLFEGGPALNETQTAQFYAESWLLVHYLFADDARHAALVAYLDGLQRGGDARATFREAFGYGVDKLDADLKRYRDGRLAYATVTLPGSERPAIAVRALSPAADTLLLPYVAMTVGIADPKAEAATVARVQRAAARFPDDAFARKVLARAEINSGDRQAGVRLVDALLQDTPNDAELLYLRGVADFYAGRSDDAARHERYALARPWFERALHADPAYYTAAYRLAQCEIEADGAGSAAALEHLRMAQADAPLVGDIAIDAAQVLAAHGRVVEARRALLPLVADPHVPGGARALKALSTLEAP